MSTLGTLSKDKTMVKHKLSYHFLEGMKQNIHFQKSYGTR